MNNSQQKFHLERLLTGGISRGVFHVVSDLTENDIEGIVTALETFKYISVELVEFAKGSSLDVLIEELSIKFSSPEINSLSNIILTASDYYKDRIQLRLLTCIFNSIVSSGSVVFNMYSESESLPLLYEEVKLIQKAIECSKNNVFMLYFTQEIGNNQDNAINVIQLNNNEINSKNMNNRLHNVHVTYKHDKEHDAAVSQLEVGFMKNKIKYSIDKDDIKYRDDIEAYEKEIGNSDRVVMFITDGYLKSLACMFEMTCIFDNKDFVERIYPIVHLKDIQRDFSGLSTIKEHWISQKEQRIKAIEKSGSSEFIQNELAKIERLLEKLDILWTYIVNINTGDYNLLIANNAEQLMKNLLESMNSTSPANSGDFVPSGDTAPNVAKKIVNQGGKSVYVENNTGTININ